MNLLSQVKKVGVAGIVGCVLFGSGVSANIGKADQVSDELRITMESPYEIAGLYEVSRHALQFDSFINEEGDVTFIFSIDGKRRELHFQVDSAALSLRLGEAEITQQERILMYDAAKTLVDYVQKKKDSELHEPLIVAVGALGSWEQLSLD